MPRSRLALLLLPAALSLSPGCASYTAPGPGARIAPDDLQKLRLQQSDVRIEQLMALKPLAQFPASIAVARVESSGYRSYTVHKSYGEGAYSVVTQRDVETDADFDRLSKLPNIRGIVPVSRLLLPADLKTDEPLRLAAARAGADMLLIYTLDTSFRDEDNARPLSVITLGLSPNQVVKLSTTASALLLDTRNGYVYGAAEATESADQLTNAWQSSEAADQARLRSEKKAFQKLVGELEKTWTQVNATYAKPTTAVAK
jgi:hypothetical protein